MAQQIAQDIGGVTDPGGDEFTTGSVNPANQVMVELLLLIHYIAEIEARLKFDFLSKKDFITFYATFRDLSLKVAHILDEDVVNEIEDYFDKMPALINDTKRFEQAKLGLKLAIDLKDAMVGSGFMRYFDTPNDPPFMQPFFDDDFTKIPLSALGIHVTGGEVNL